MDFSRLQTPADHGDVLVEPAASELARAIEQNKALLDSYDFRVQNLSAREARTLTRSRLGQSEGPLIVTGHQPDFIHAGVWAKHVVACRLAEASGGSAVNLVVDHDAPKQTALPVPTVGAERLTTRRIVYAQWPAGAAFEGLPAVEREAARRFAQETRTALGYLEERSMLRTFFERYTRDKGGADWVDQQVSARRAVESEFGIGLADHRVSDVWCGPLLGAMIAEPDRFADAYNRALAAYRRRFGIRGSQRPVPDLHRDADQCELALWAYRVGEPRRRVFTRRSRGTVTLLAGNEPFAAMDADSATSWHRLCKRIGDFAPWAVRPRALTLTLWARLFASDVFIHGIGGAKYDRVTDDLVRIFFGVEPPLMACVSATLRLDLPRHAVDHVAMNDARRRIRDVEYNPQRYATGSEAVDLVAAREHAVAESRRLREHAPRDRVARRRVFSEIRALSERINRALPALRQEAANKLDMLNRQEEENRTAASREWFFAMHAGADLELLLENLPSVHDLR